MPGSARCSSALCLLLLGSYVLHNDSPSSSSKGHEHRSSCEDSGTLSILTCYITCLQRRYFSPAHALTDFKCHPTLIKLVNKAPRVGVMGNMTVKRSMFEQVPHDYQSNALPLRHTALIRHDMKSSNHWKFQIINVTKAVINHLMTFKRNEIHSLRRSIKRLIDQFG